jgi:phthalate 4,5-dioxygenase
MLSKEDNEIITQTDRGTPMGELFRRFWLPALLSEEIPAADCDPVRVRVMGEDLVAFRDSDGRPGVVNAYCAHRGAPMYFGRNEECGIRCLYHGWKYDVTGQCVEVPNVPNGAAAAARLRIIAYPAQEGAGMVWIYMGPPERKPPFPEFPFFDEDASHYVTKYEVDCNWLQGLEGDMDPSHVQFLHSTLGNNIDENYLLNPNMQEDGRRPPKPDFEHTATIGMADTEVGLLFAGVRPTADKSEMRVQAQHVILPTFPSAGLAGSTEPGVFSMNIRTPIDDEHEMHYRLRWTKRGFTEKELWQYTHGGYVFPRHIPGTWRAEENKDNDYLWNPVLRRQYNFSGILPFPTQDLSMIENQWGPIADRTQEHLLSSDVRIIFARQRLLRMAKDLADGIEPEEPFHMTDLHGNATGSDPLMVASTSKLSDQQLEELAARFHTKLKVQTKDRGAQVELGDVAAESDAVPKAEP